MPVTRWIRRLCLAGVLLCFSVVVLGAYVRLTAAGLGCPDWPGCYGQVTPLGAEQSTQAQAAFPSRPLEVGKAWREMIHRYAATTLGAVIVTIVSLAIYMRRNRVVSLPYAWLLLAIVVFQGLLGMFTVTRQLKPLIVTAHLVFGLSTLGLLWWLWLSLPRDSGSSAPAARGAPANGGAGQEATPHGLWRPRLWRLTLLGLVALGLQIALGGWTSSNYAAIACPDFPTCQNVWWPHSDFRNAFVLWRGLAVNYEGGILDSAARVAIHVTHRLGAVVATLTLGIAAITVLTRPPSARFAFPAIAVLAALALQLTIGITMVLRGFPIWLATAHTAGAALILLCVLTLLHALREPAAGRSI